MADNQVDLKLNLDFQGVNDALYQMIGQFNGTDKEFLKITNSMEKNAKNLEGAIKLFGPASVEAGRYLKALQKDFISLAANGVDPASDAFKKMSASIPTPGKIDATAGAVKKSNMQYTNLALVLQDLPYGFRGIQNNLPALIGGMAGVTGAFYLAASAAIALYTAYDMGLFKSKEATEKAKEKTEALKKQKDATDSLYDSTAQEAAQVAVLMSVIKSETETRDRKLTALKDLKEINPLIFNGLTLEKNAVVGLDDAYKNYLGNLGTIIAVKTKQAELESIIAKRLKAQGATLSQEEQDIVATGKALDSALNTKRTDLELRTRSTKQQSKEAKQQVLINGLLSQEEKITRNIQQLSSGIKLKDPKTDTNKPDTKPIVSKVYENLAQEEFNFYKDSIFRAEEYFVKLNNIQKINALMEASIRGASFDELFTIQQTYEQKEINFKKSIEDKKFAIRKQSDERQQQLTKANDDLKLKAEKELTDKAVYFTTQRIKAVQTEADASIKANRGNYQAQKQALEDAIVKLGVFRMAAIGGAEAMLKLDEAITNNKAKIEGLVDPLETLNQTLQNTFNQLNIDMVSAFAENIGEMLAGGEFDFSKLGNILADGLSSIGKALIAFALTSGAALELFKDPKTWPLALAAGIAAVAAGSFLKSKLSDNKATAFANGGIVSGPTMGLVGEYPGAQNNPEVIAPLDKLKSMIGGGGGGAFVLRGQDLLLSVNRAQKASNLKGQNISLA